MRVTVKLGKCGLCGNPKDEGVEIKLWWFIKCFICEGCISKIFRMFRKEK